MLRFPGQAGPGCVGSPEGEDLPRSDQVPQPNQMSCLHERRLFVATWESPGSQNPLTMATHWCSSARPGCDGCDCAPLTDCPLDPIICVNLRLTFSEISSKRHDTERISPDHLLNFFRNASSFG